MKNLVMVFSIVILCSLVTPAQQEWFWQNPQPQGNYLRSTSFINANEGWAVGEGWVILHTTDGGQNWELQNSGIWSLISGDDELTAVHFVDENYGTAIGGNGLILRTTDGGQNWFSQVSGTTATLKSVSFYDNNHGAISVSSTLTLITSDGGETWINSNFNIVLVSYMSANFIWGASSGYIRFTTNGGQSWNEQYAGGTIYDICFISPTTGFVLANGLRRTTDGGATWTVTTAPTGGIGSKISFVDENIGTIINTNHDIYRTTDGGQSWVAQTNEINEPLYDVHFTDANNGTTVGANGVILRTTNGGDNWINQRKRIILPNWSIGQNLWDVAFSGPNSAIAVGDRGKIIKTTDGGLSWSELVSGLDSTVNDRINGIYCIDENIATAVGNVNKILRTTDGGQNWNLQPTPVYSNWSGVSFTDANNGIVVGSGGRILKTTDGGTNWILQISGVTNNLEKVSHADQNSILVVGAQGRILKSTDGGNSWLIKNSGTTALLTEVSYIDENTATVAGGTILRTSDGGETWSTQIYTGGTSFGGLCFTDINNGIGLGFGGNILYTTDGGQNWLPAYGKVSGGQHNLRAVAVSSINKMIALGWQAIIVTSEGVTPNNAPLFVSPTPECGSTINVDVGSPVSFTIAAEDGDAGDVVTLSVIGLPSGSSMDPVLPASSNPVSSIFNWTPDLASVGNHAVTFKITDNNSDPVSCSFNIEVVNDNTAPIFVSPTPECGSTLSVFAGSPINFSVHAEDEDVGNSVTLSVIGLPSGSSMDPALPASGNPVSSMFNWTPTSSDVGTYEIIYTATDNFTASALCTLTIFVEDIPAVVCPLNQLYWEANPSVWPVSELVLGTVNNYTATDLLSILGSSVRSDASITLAKQLIAAKLNAANGAPVPTAVANAIANADNTIGSLIIPANIRLFSRTGITMLIQAIYLWAYNNNFLTTDCGSTLSKQMAVEEEIAMPVYEYTLFDNYPNPFNPTTKIMYTVPNNEFVTLKVFNTIGEEVMTLVNEVKQQGLYEVEFNSNGLPSGVYLYRIIAGDFVSTKKMMLMK